MKRTLIFGDIHGGLKSLEQVLERASVTTEDKLIFLGDYVDRYPDSFGVIEKLIELSSTNECIFIRGNHDQWFLECLSTYSPSNRIWKLTGGSETIRSYVNSDHSKFESHKKFLEKTVLYYEEGRTLFVHGGFTNSHSIQKEPYESNFYWDRTLWESAVLLQEVLEHNKLFVNIPKRFTLYDKIFIGHTCTLNHGQDKPMQSYSVVNIDTGGGFSNGRLTCYSLHDDLYWQSDRMSQLYPSVLTGSVNYFNNHK
jgi:serine/threonine protein phosphatase 1